MTKDAQPTQQFVDIAEIKENVVILKSGSLRRILMVSGVNFELKSEEEQDIILTAYQEFLNSLDFGIQILIHSRRLNVNHYLEKLEERLDQEKNELLKNQITEYNAFVKSFVSNNAIMTKNFFVIVPYDSFSLPKASNSFFDFLPLKKKVVKVPQSVGLEETLEQKILQLDQRTDQVINGLSQIGLRVVVLNKEEIVELLYNFYNPHAFEIKDLKIVQE
jgi:type IV secretory pathway VirB4 component